MTKTSETPYPEALNKGLQGRSFERYNTPPESCASDQSWLLEQAGFDPSREREMETLFSLGNGFLGIRGSISLLIPTSEADLFIAGIYGHKAPRLPYSEREFLSSTRKRVDPYSELIPFPSPYGIKLHVAGKPLSIMGSNLILYERTLDLRRGLLKEKFELREEEGRETELQTLRCASLADHHLVLQEIRVSCRNHSDPIGIDAYFENPDFAPRYPHLKKLRIETPPSLSNVALYETSHSRVRSCFPSKLFINDVLAGSGRGTFLPSGGASVLIRRMTGIFTSRETDEVIDRASGYMMSKDKDSFDVALEEHVRKWGEFWSRADILYSGNPGLTHAQRFNSYHLKIGMNHDPTVSLPARSLTGRAYEGHVFWDADIFDMPFFLHTDPESARCMLAYRHHTLAGARARARRLGYDGASFAWESASSGEEATPPELIIGDSGRAIPVFTGAQQIHITADIAYAIRRYWDATADHDFLAEKGVEILLETARFWSTRVTERQGRFHIEKVVGPDEYHHSVNDNAFTNWMVRYNFDLAFWALEWMKTRSRADHKKLLSRLRLRTDEVENWKRIRSSLHVPMPGRDGVIEQFAGFFDLKDVPPRFRNGIHLKAPINRLLAWEEINHVKIVKQADVLMIPFLFPDALSDEIIAANYAYYEPRTDHASSLSPPVHAGIAARLGRMEDARKYWEMSLNLDMLNLMNNSALGFHAGCAGGAWQSLVFHFLDARFDGNALHLNLDRLERLGLDCDGVDLKLAFRGKVLSPSPERVGGRLAS